MSIILQVDPGSLPEEEVGSTPPRSQNFNFACFYQGSSSLAYAEVLDIKVKTLYKDFPNKIRDSLLIALKSVVQFKFFASRDSTELESSWFCVVLRDGDAEPQIFQGVENDLELVPFCFPVIMQLKCCIKGSQRLFWKLEVIGSYRWIESPHTISLRIVPERYSTPSHPSRSPVELTRKVSARGSGERLSTPLPPLPPPLAPPPPLPAQFPLPLPADQLMPQPSAAATVGAAAVAQRAHAQPVLLSTFEMPAAPASVASVVGSEETRVFILEVIKDITLFTPYALEEERKSIVRKFHRRNAYKGELLVRQGQIGVYFHVIESGTVGMYHDRDDGRVERVRQLHSGKYFGDMEIQRQSPAAYSAVAEEDCVLWRLAATHIRLEMDIPVDE